MRVAVMLEHPTDPRYLLLEEPLPARISPDEAFGGKYGRLLTTPGPLPVVPYSQPDGFGTAWVAS